jgi:hypothetical protein
MWWTEGTSAPELVTVSPPLTPQSAAGVLGQPGTEVLFGGGQFTNDLRSGGRLVIGSWLDDCRTYGMEGEYFGLGQDTFDFQRQSNGDQILARPFFNVLTGRQDSELVAFPGLINGSIDVQGSSELHSAGARLRLNLDRQGTGSCGSSYSGAGCGDGTRLDLLVGYRFLELDEGLTFREDLVSTDPLRPATFDIRETFGTRSDFHGGEIGLEWQYDRCRWSLEMLAKIALGNCHQVVTIDGSTTITSLGIPATYPGGLLAQRTNIGRFARGQFVVVPEVGVTLAYELTESLKASFGYSFVFVSDVVRPGDQIDTGVNPDLLPPEAVPFSGPLQPAFAFHGSGFWAQGLGFGVEYGW